MGRKYLTISQNALRMKVYLDDVQNVFSRKKKILPKVPRFDNRKDPPSCFVEREHELEF